MGGDGGLNMEDVDGLEEDDEQEESTRKGHIGKNQVQNGRILMATASARQGGKGLYGV